jgi:hypothetical protein
VQYSENGHTDQATNDTTNRNPPQQVSYVRGSLAAAFAEASSTGGHRYYGGQHNEHQEHSCLAAEGATGRNGRLVDQIFLPLGGRDPARLGLYHPFR